MNPMLTHLVDGLVEETGRQCGHERRKGQLSMSWLHLPNHAILERMANGCIQGDLEKLKLYQGTLCERGMRERLEAVCQANQWLWQPPELLTAFEGRLTGHTDGAINDLVVEIKTVPNGDVLHAIQRTELPFKVRSQVQSYILWGQYSGALVIYESRADGQFAVLPVNPDLALQSQLQQKVTQLLQQM